MPKYDRFSLFRLSAWIFLLITFVFFLIIAKSLLVPVALALLVAFLLYPIADFLERKARFPRWASTLVSVLLAVAIIGTAGYFAIKQAENFVSKTPNFKENVKDNINEMQENVERVTSIQTEKQDEWINGKLNSIMGEGGNMLNGMLKATMNTVVAIGLLPVYAFLILFYRNKFYNFIKEVISRDYQKNAEKIMTDISNVTKRYMTGILTVVTILAVLNSLGLFIVGVKYAILLGIISALCNIIPYFGTLIGGAVALLVSFFIQGDTSVLIGIGILFVIIQFTENNILTPNITGGQVKLNPFITILSIVAGGMIWGIPGMFVSVPFLGMFKIICDHIDSMNHISKLLGSGKE